MTKRIALVTGATGFVGSHLVKRLLNENWCVHIIIRPSSNLQQLQSVQHKLTPHTHDGTVQSMMNIVGTAQPSVVFHLASLFIAEHKYEDITNLIESNIRFGNHLVEAMIKHQVNYLVNTGTSWQHYQNKDYSPVCLYSATKQAFEVILQYYIEAHALKVITLKLFDTYGPDDPRHKLFYLLNQIAKAQQPLAMSPGEQLIDLVHINDVVNAFVIAAERLLTSNISGHEKYAVSSGNPLTLKKLVHCYEQIMQQDLPIVWGGRKYRRREVMVPWNKGQWIPSWEPQVKLEDGLKLKPIIS
jgi:nucleoside-diphosphate-sugar epimerase